jgi:Cu/Ag efflux protein CusF
MMMCLTKWLSATFAIVLLAGTVAAAENSVARGKVKSFDPDKMTFVLTDSSDKDITFKFDDHFVVNRDGKEGKSDLKAGDPINVCYAKARGDWNAHYVLVQEGKGKNCELIQGNVKGYDADKKELTFTNESDKTSTYTMGDAKVRLNMEATKIDNVKNGDRALLIVDTVDGKPMLSSLMIERAK